MVYGYVEGEPEIGGSVLIHQARMVTSWRGGKGLFGLAAEGPRAGTLIQAAVRRHADEHVRAWIEVSPAAAAAIDAWEEG